MCICLDTAYGKSWYYWHMFLCPASQYHSCVILSVGGQASTASVWACTRHREWAQRGTGANLSVLENIQMLALIDADLSLIAEGSCLQNWICYTRLYKRWWTWIDKKNTWINIIWFDLIFQFCRKANVYRVAIQDLRPMVSETILLHFKSEIK